MPRSFHLGPTRSPTTRSARALQRYADETETRGTDARLRRGLAAERRANAANLDRILAQKPTKPPRSPQ
jgi:hypothetical protein